MLICAPKTPLLLLLGALLLADFAHCDVTDSGLPDAVLIDDTSLEINAANGLLQADSTTVTTIKFYQRLPPPSNKTIEINATNNLLNTSQPMKILVHGEQETSYEDWIEQTAVNYHAKGNYNIVLMDYSEYSIRDTILSRTLVNESGSVLAEFIIEVTEASVEHLGLVHLIGNGAGAHISGDAGRKIQGRQQGGKVGRITGLDPDTQDIEDTLASEDAEFVDVIHAASFDAFHSYGTVDFYIMSNESGVLCTNGGSAAEYFSETILEMNRYMAVACLNSSAYFSDLCDDGDEKPLGEYVDWNSTGSYYYPRSGGSTAGLAGLAVLAAAIISYHHL